MRTPFRELILFRDNAAVFPGLLYVDTPGILYSPGKDTPGYFKQNWLPDTGGPS